MEPWIRRAIIIFLGWISYFVLFFASIILVSWATGLVGDMRKGSFMSDLAAQNPETMIKLFVSIGVPFLIAQTAIPFAGGYFARDKGWFVGLAIVLIVPTLSVLAVGNTQIPIFTLLLGTVFGYLGERFYVAKHRHH